MHDLTGGTKCSSRGQEARSEGTQQSSDSPRTKEFTARESLGAYSRFLHIRRPVQREEIAPGVTLILRQDTKLKASAFCCPRKPHEPTHLLCGESIPGNLQEYCRKDRAGSCVRVRGADGFRACSSPRLRVVPERLRPRV